ncbi:MAG TPA: sigma-70 family RNA polymerase sigma factor [Acidimicrobiales bacterium]
MASEAEEDFETFAARVWLPLRQALVGALGADRGSEAHALAMAYAWEHRDGLGEIESPVGYLFTVGRSQTRNRRKALPPVYPPPPPDLQDYEPELPRALAALPEKQRVAVFLVVGCGWSNAEVGRLTGRSESTVRAHVTRGLARLRRQLAVEEES